MSIKKIVQDIADKAEDYLEPTSNTTSRAGHTVERVGKLVEGAIPNKVIALLMTENSPTNQVYTSSDIDSYDKIYQDAKKKVVVTAQQTRALLRDTNGGSEQSSEYQPA